MMIDRARVAAALPGYELGDQIGAGAFGLVLAGWHRGLHRDVAVKVLSTRGHDRAAAGSATEARLLARFDHPHIIRVHDYVEADDLHLIVTEMMAGGTLTSHQADITQQSACAIGLAVAGALSYAHSQGVLHRDIKPDNMLFDTAGLLKVADFGIAKLLDGADAAVNTVIGTPLFMAPEQIAGARLGPATDLYALGLVLYLLLTGTAPFDPAPTPSRRRTRCPHR
ncbi:serine/threonine-protein kinase [Parafrankia discariae]|uniref:serine/threonine-protein kinase n=1 Tax=Parafrankia discariae TaxID=365528 RepID=UPI00047752F7|nr:serine/threonine-protein kinase [Parafrankia discariae]